MIGLLRTWRGRAAFASALVALCMASGPVQAHRVLPRHSSDNRAAFQYRQYPDAEDRVVWWFENSFPGKVDGTSAHKRAVLRASRAWNDRGRRFTFADQGNREVAYNAPYEQVRGVGEGRRRYCGATRGRARIPLSLVFWEGLESDQPGTTALGEAATCLHNAHDGIPRHPFKFFMALNRAFPSWYTGSSTSVPGEAGAPDAEQDMQGVAMHEFGHASGFARHYDGANSTGLGGAICERTNSKRETMCALSTQGAAWARTLGPHDRHTWDAAYPAR